MNSRQSTILMMLSHEEISVQHLALHFNVSEMTIRRDLDFLSRRGDLIRTHGGAVLSKSGIVEFTFQEKGRIHAAEKRSIAHEVAVKVRPGMTITLDTGTTTLEVARAISGVHDLTVLTSSLPIASCLYTRDNIELVLLGGIARKGSPDLSGWLTEENLKHFKVDMAIVGADGILQDGLYTTDIQICCVSQAILAGAKHKVLVADHSKFGKSAFVCFAPWQCIDAVYTDENLPEKVHAWLHKTGVQMTLAKVQ